ncbi:MAG: NADH-quinone oxidoreductase subunit G [Rhodospirillales bacterium]|nr:NADH-quinone oxidoreductase subunit G [Rhodospirillales bacterium]
MPTLTINGTEIEVEKGTSILQAAEMLGVEIPHFCYHGRLSVPANCRMCLVEVKGGPPKPAASCAMSCADGMEVHTDSEMVQKARKGVMEMMLINHPLDCPICDQGGECDLQDQAVAYGFDRSRYAENKRAVPNKELGPIIKTIMTRCINCTRCVRFAEEIAGVETLGQLNRGEDAEIGTFIEQAVDTELSGNLVDVCPVGALTSKPYAFKARPWELVKTQSVDVMDAVGSNIRIDSRSGEVLRILPRLHEDINEEWISDKTRYAYDGLTKRRLDRPWLRNPQTNQLEECGWPEAFSFIAEKLKGLKGSEIAALAGDLCDLESMTALKDLMTGLGSPHLDCRTDGTTYDPSNRAGYLFNTTIAGIEEADAILIVGANPRYEATMVNARIRKNWLDHRTKIALIGDAVDLTYPYEHLGDGWADLEKFMKARSGFAKIFKEAQRPMIIFGAHLFTGEGGAALHAYAMEAAEKLGVIKDNWNGFNLLQTAASRVGGLDIGFVPQEKTGKGFSDILAGTRDGSIKALYLLGADEFDARSEIGWNTFVIYQGHHGDRGAAMADVILPGSAYTEKDALYVNLEGRVQEGWRAVFPPGEAKEDWKILRALSEYVLKAPLSYDNLKQLRTHIYATAPHLVHLGDIIPALWTSAAAGKRAVLPAEAQIFAFTSKSGYYATNSVARASQIMRACEEAFVPAVPLKEAAE